MTIASRHFAAVPRPHRGSLARFGVAGSLVLWGFTLAGTPFYVIGALAAGVLISLIDGLRTRLGTWRAVRRETKRLLSRDAEGWSGVLARIVGSAEPGLRPHVRTQPDQFVISLPRAGAFTIDATTPSLGARHLLERLAVAIEAGSWRIDVIGYDDGPRPDTSLDERTEPAGLSLSLQRAHAALKALRDAGCRQPIAALGAPLPSELNLAPPAPAGAADPAGIEIVIRRGPHEGKDAA